MSSTGENAFPKLDIELEKFHRYVTEVKCIQEKTIKAHEKKTEVESKMTQELKVTRAREIRLEEVSRRAAELQRALSRKPTVADTDRARLELARDKYEVAKELTGVRFNYEAPPDVVKGYVKNRVRGVLEPFEVREAGAADALWPVLERAAGF